MSIAKTSEEYFEEWHPYDLLIKHNYMCHQEMITCLRKRGEALDIESGQLLELGCGNAYTAAEAFEQVHKLDYTGVDLSKTALEAADESLSRYAWKVQLIESDIRIVLEEFDQAFDLIVAGFSLHHFSSAENLQILKAAKKHLRQGGELVIYDIVTLEDEDRVQFNDRLIAGIYAREMGMSEHQIETIRHHITHYDFPISLSNWRALAEEAGFTSMECDFRDEEERYAFIRFF